MQKSRSENKDPTDTPSSALNSRKAHSIKQASKVKNLHHTTSINSETDNRSINFDKNSVGGGLSDGNSVAGSSTLPGNYQMSVSNISERYNRMGSGDDLSKVWLGYIKVYILGEDFLNDHFFIFYTHLL